jgi:hypothetical protein
VRLFRSIRAIALGRKERNMSGNTEEAKRLYPTMEMAEAAGDHLAKHGIAGEVGKLPPWEPAS